jgi:hypothetical protein
MPLLILWAFMACSRMNFIQFVPAIVLSTEPHFVCYTDRTASAVFFRCPRTYRAVAANMSLQLCRRYVALLSPVPLWLLPVNKYRKSLHTVRTHWHTFQFSRIRRLVIMWLLTPWSRVLEKLTSLCS